LVTDYANLVTSLGTAYTAAEVLSNASATKNTDAKDAAVIALAAYDAAVASVSTTLLARNGDNTAAMGKMGDLAALQET